jgi:hypothetical protein
LKRETKKSFCKRKIKFSKFNTNIYFFIFPPKETYAEIEEIIVTSDEAYLQKDKGYSKLSGSLLQRSHKKERAPSQPSHTSYSVPFHFVESGRKNQLLICEGQKYILNNKYGEKSCKLK